MKVTVQLLPKLLFGAKPCNLCSVSTLLFMTQQQ